jgi:hypothetical protein
MSFKEKLRKVFLCVFLGGSFLGSQISHEKIAELLNAVNQPRAEETITEENEIGKSTREMTSSETGPATGPAATQRNTQPSK